MTGQEWEAIALILEHGWHGAFTDDESDAYCAILGDYDRQEVEAAVKQLARAGLRYRPSVGEIAHAIEQHSAPLSFDEAWSVIEGALIRHGSSSADDRDQCILDDIRQRAGETPVGWVASYGVKRLLLEPLQGDYRGSILHRLRENYEGLISTEPGRQRLLEAAKHPQLGPAERKGLHRVDPAGLIGGGA